MLSFFYETLYVPIIFCNLGAVLGHQQEVGRVCYYGPTHVWGTKYSSGVYKYLYLLKGRKENTQGLRGKP